MGTAARAPRHSARLIVRACCALSALFAGGDAIAAPVLAQSNDTVVLLAPSPDERAAWSEVVRGLRALGKRAVQVAELGVDPVYAACRATECGRQLAQLAQQPVLLVTFSEADARVRLQLITPAGGEVDTQGAGTASTRAAAVAELFKSASEQLALGDRAKLRIESAPTGAVVWLDGEPIGVTPTEQDVVAGAHDLRVALAGRVPVEQPLSLLPGEVRELALPLPRALPLLEPAGQAAAARATHAARVASPVNFMLAGALSLAALPLVISGANTWANDDQCLDLAADGCRARARFGTRSAVQLALGAAALLAGGYFFAWHPLQIDAEIATDRAALRLRQHF